jgi:hypothetical protein
MSGVDVRLTEVLTQLGEEEREVILYQAERLLMGQKQYGKLNLAADTRDFRVEMRQEVSDWHNYDAMDHVRTEKANFLDRVRAVRAELKEKGVAVIPDEGRGYHVHGDTDLQHGICQKCGWPWPGT